MSVFEFPSSFPSVHHLITHTGAALPVDVVFMFGCQCVNTLLTNVIQQSVCLVAQFPGPSAVFVGL